MGGKRCNQKTEEADCCSYYRGRNCAGGASSFCDNMADRECADGASGGSDGSGIFHTGSSIQEKCKDSPESGKGGQGPASGGACSD